MVLYGEEEEQMMASSPLGSDIRTIWDEKIVKPYSPTVAEVDSVLAGKGGFPNLDRNSLRILLPF